MALGINIRCPVSDDAIPMVGEEAWGVELYRRLAQFYQISIVDITEQALTLAVINAERAEQAEPELTDRIRDAKRDAALLKLELPIEEAIEILLRAREGLQWLAQHSPDEERRRQRSRRSSPSVRAQWRSCGRGWNGRNAAIAKRRAAQWL